MLVKFSRIVIFAALAASPAFAADWRAYRNDRFGTSADIPAGWRMGEEPANSDGRIFTSPDGRATITVSGSYAVLPRAEEFALRLAADQGKTIQYKKQGRDWLVVSGRNGARIFYRKSLLSCGGEVWNSVSLDYPADEKAAFDPIVAHVAGSLRGGKGYGTGDCR
jgi:hypothetical protein